MTPTDADRQRADDIVDAHSEGIATYHIHASLVNDIAAAIAAARAEALEQAIAAVQDGTTLTVKGVTFSVGDFHADKIRALKEPGHE